MPKSVTDYFDREFNRRLGNRVGRPINRPKSRVPKPNYSKKGGRVSSGSRRSQVRSGNVNISAQNRRKTEQVFREKRTRRGSAVERYNEAVTRSAKQEEDFDRRLAAMSRIVEEIGVDVDRPSRNNSLFGRGMDIISRPGYALFEGMRNTLDTGEEGPGHSKGILESLGDLGQGAWAGLSGQEKTGFGDVVEEWKDSGGDIIGGSLREMEENNPDQYKWLSRGLGLIGDLGLDPLNQITLGSGAYMKNGARLTDDLLEGGAREIAERTAKSTFDDAPGFASTPGKMTPKRPQVDVIAELAGDSAAETARKSLLTVKGGPQRGKVSLGRPADFANAAANKAAEAMRAQKLRPFEKQFNEWLSIVERGQVPAPTLIRKWRRNPEFDTFLNYLEESMNIRRTANPVEGIDEAMAIMAKSASNGSESFRKMALDSAQRVHDELDGPILEAIQKMRPELETMTYNAPVLRLGKAEIGLKPVGKAYAKVKKGVEARRIGDAADAMSYGRQFPGRMTTVTQKVRSTGVRNHEKFAKEVASYAKKFSKDETKRISAAYFGGGDIADPRLQEALDFLRNSQREMWQKQTIMGVRGPKDVEVDDFAYIWNKGGKKGDRTRFKNERKQNIRNKGERGNDLKLAKEMGLNPVENPFEAILYYSMKHQRDLTRTSFLRDLVDHYGFVGKRVSSKQLTERQVVEVSKDTLPHDIVAKLGPNDHIYLPKAHKEMYDTFTKLMAMGANDELNQMMRALENITTKYKTLVTLYNPGYHSRNFVGDGFMGLLDGVKTRTYGEVISKWVKAKAGKHTSFTIAPGWNMSFDEFWEKFQHEASSGGYFQTEAPGTVRSQLGGFSRKVRDLGEAREDLGRIAHYLHALRDEASHYKKFDENTIEKISEAATFRVNHYKFDYGALTAVERRPIKTMFPFYTFIRKALPTILEAMYMSPKNLVRVNSFMQDLNERGTGAENFSQMVIPQWMREQGYAQLTTDEEPLVITEDILPTAVGTNISTNNTQDFFQSILSQANPIVNFPYEQAMGRQMFNGQPTGPLAERLMQMTGPFAAAQKLHNNDTGILEQLLSSRLGLGASIRRVTKEQQEYSLRDLEDQEIEGPIRDFNYSQENFRIYPSDRGNEIRYRVKDVAANQVLAEFQTPEEAIDFARNAKVPAGRKPIET